MVSSRLVVGVLIACQLVLRVDDLAAEFRRGHAVTRSGAVQPPSGSGCQDFCGVGSWDEGISKCHLLRSPRMVPKEVGISKSYLG